MAQSDLPRPLRILRKRLRALGLMPPASTRPRVTGSAAWLRLANAAGPHLADAFKRHTPFEAWIEVNTLTDAAELELRRRLLGTAGLPKISIITPTYNTDPSLLTAMIASVQAQIYDNWELCVADDGSTNNAVRDCLEHWSKIDPRIKWTQHEVNRGISEATNSAVQIASGEIIAFVDHDDLITKDCLAEVALYYASRSDTDMLYSDDDKIDMLGVRSQPQFKPDWSPILLLSYMYMSHLLTVRRELFEKLGGFRSEFDGSQDYDFALRASEHCRHIGHIPRILYHWRAAPGSTATSGDAKPESFEAGRKAVEEALARRSISGRVEHPAWAQAAKVGMFSIRFPDNGPSVTIVIPTYNHAALLRECIESISSTTYKNFDIIVADNNSDEIETIEYLKSLKSNKNIKLIKVANGPNGFSFSDIVNKASKHVDAEYILLLNNDTQVISPHWLSQMVGFAKMEGVGAVGARLHFEDGTLQHAGIVHGYHEGLVGHAFRAAPPHDWGYMGFVRSSREYSAVTAACLLTRRDLFEDMGGFNTKEFSVAYNDVDYCYRLIDRDLRCIYCADADLFHFESKSRGPIDDPREVLALRRRYGNRNDPWYNPNLSLRNEQFQIETRRLAPRTTSPVCTAFVSHNLNFEGAPNTLFDLVLGLKNAGAVDPIVLAPCDGPLRQAYEAHGVPVILFDAPPVGAAAETFQQIRSRFSARLSGLGVNVVVANTLTMFFAIGAAKECGLSSIWCQHESEPWESYFDAERPEVRLHAYASFGQAYRVTYVAQATMKAWAPVQTRANAQVIRHGIPAARMDAERSRWSRQDARAQLDASPQDTVIILMGTVCRRKGQMDLLGAVAEASAGALKDTRVFIVGALAERDYVDEIQRAHASLPPELQNKVTIVGSAPDMALYYAAADLLVCTSRIESAPRILVEAMAFDLPIITTPVFGIPELVDEGRNALFYEPGDTSTLLGLILKLAQNSDERARLAAISRACLESRPGYTEMIEQYAQLISEAAQLRRTPSGCHKD